MALIQTSAAGPLPTFTGVYVFGDSLVDPGNALKASNFLDDLPFTAAPDRAPTAARGYFEGRFSDGLTFADLVSNKLIGKAQKTTFPYGFEDPLLGIPITLGGRPDGNNLSFAYGGAQAVRGSELVPDFDEQTDAYRNSPAADPNALYIVVLGGNDVRDMVPRNSAPRMGDAAARQLSDIAAEIADEVAQLYAFGARHVLVAGIPDVGLIPYYAGATDEALKRTLATDYSTRLDALIRTALEGLTLPTGATLHGFSLDAFGDKVAAAPAAYGITDLTHGRTIVQQGALEPVGAGYLFFDDVHPSAQTHALATAEILASLGGTPETTVARQAGPRLFAAVEAQGGSDTFTAELVAGRAYTIDALGISGGDGTLGDPRLTIRAPGGAVVVQDDDAGLGLNARAQFVATETGVYTIQVSGVGVSTGGYVLQGADLRGTAVRIEGSTAADTLGAAAGTNYLRGAEGADSIAGGTGFDDANGNMGDDTLSTGAGDDYCVGGKDNDLLFGDAGLDFVYGNLGDDTCHGGDGNDIMRGGQGNDTLAGGEGADFVSGDRGDDTMTGGAGADIFHSSGDAGLDRVLDFSLAQGDRVQLDPGTTFTVAQVGGDTVIQMSAGQVILVGVTAASLPPGTIFGA